MKLSLNYKKITKSNKKKYIRKKYINFINKYKVIVPMDIHFYKYLFYSIMIMENYNRPPYLRLLERIIFIFRTLFGKNPKMTLGIMQITTTKMISDKESINLANKKIIKDIYNVMNSSNELEISAIIKKVALLYNNNNLYADEVINIYKILQNISIQGG